MTTEALRQEFTQFDYLLNAFELASQSDKPAEHGYGEKRRALYAYVRGLEAASLRSSSAGEVSEERIDQLASAHGLDNVGYELNPMARWRSFARAVLKERTHG